MRENPEIRNELQTDEEEEKNTKQQHKIPHMQNTLNKQTHTATQTKQNKQKMIR